MNRRTFFTALLAPFVARFLPKEKPAGEVLWWVAQKNIPWKPTEAQSIMILESTAHGYADFIGGSSIVIPNPRTGFRLSGNNF